MARRFFFGLEHLKEALEKLRRVWNQDAFIALVAVKCVSKGAFLSAALLAERAKLGAAVAEALNEYPEA